MGNKRWTYKRQLLYYFAGVFSVFAILLVVFQLHSERRYKQQILQSRLSVYADLIAGTEDWPGMLPMLPGDLRVTVMEKNGTVVFDSAGNLDFLDNHFLRPEVQISRKTGEGSSVRTSSTTGIPYFYFAKSYDNGIVRVAMPYRLDVKKFFRPDTLFLIIVILLFLVALFTVIFLADRFGQGVSRLHSLAEAAKKGNVDYGNISFPESELGDIGVSMLESYRRLDQSNRIIALEKERLLLHIHYYDEGIAIFSPGRKKVYANAKFVQYVNTLLERPTPDLDDIWKCPVFSPLEEFLVRNTPVESESAPVFQYRTTKGGRNYGIQILVYPDNGFEITVNDVTEAEKNRLMKQQMTNNIAHELRTPVSSIRGYLETLTTCRGIAPERKQAFIDRAYMQVLRLSDLIRDIALITKIEEAPEQLCREKINVREIVDEVFEEFREPIEEKKMSVEDRLPADLVITGNESLIYALFRNLVENSLKYAGDGVTLHVECYAKGDGYCHFTYYDTGKGVSEEHLTRIFERFYRVSEGRTRDAAGRVSDAGGSGLGLSIVRNAVAFHKGDIRALNRPDGGLEFIFSLGE